MADPRRAHLKPVDENYVAPENPTKEQLADATRAGYIREGVSREKARTAATMTNAVNAAANVLKSAHANELDRLVRIVGKAAHRDGVLLGLVSGMALAVALAFATWFVLKEVVITNTATQRVNYPNPPTLQEPESNTNYPRINPREPANAP